mmetsp:Transcript_135780/g.290362  ORF Transcript_135780/g.290362 Transcript_135780/m.290362 type:complete len:274 (-) Transcript_135780:664-1485(-)
MLLDLLETVHKGHPRCWRPIARVAGKVAIAPLPRPRARADCQAEVDEGKTVLLLSRPFASQAAAICADVHKDVVCRDVPVEGERLQRFEDAPKLSEQIAHKVARVLEEHRALAASGQFAIDYLRDVHALVLLIADPIEPMVEHKAGNEGHGEVHCTALVALRGTVRHVSRHLVPGRCRQLCSEEPEQLGLKYARSQGFGVAGSHDLHCNGVALPNRIAHGGLPDDTKGSPANHPTKPQEAASDDDLLLSLFLGLFLLLCQPRRPGCALGDDVG